MGKYLDIAKQFDARRLKEQPRDPAAPIRPTPEPHPFYEDARECEPDHAEAWPCPQCGQPATIDDVFPSADGKRTLTMWSCEPCHVVAVTPDAIRRPPMTWVKRTQQ